MSVHTVKKEDFKQFVTTLINSDQTIVGVQAKGDHFAFDELTNADALRLDYDVTILPPKKYVLPQAEPLLSFSVGGESKSIHQARPTVLVGVHPYDMIAINKMDILFSQN